MPAVLAAWYLALHAGAPGPNGAANELPTANGYARKQQTLTVAGNVGTGVADLSFGPNTNVAWGNVSHFSLWTAAVGGTCLWVGDLTQAKTYAVDDTATVAGAALTFTLT